MSSAVLTSELEVRLGRALRGIAFSGQAGGGQCRVMARDALEGVVFPGCEVMGSPAVKPLPLVRSWLARVAADQPVKQGDVFRGWLVLMDDPREELTFYLTHGGEWVSHVDAPGHLACGMWGATVEREVWHAEARDAREALRRAQAARW